MHRMTLIRYVCTHCGRHFEAEDKEILECPGCFWSTSVKREEDYEPKGLSGEAPAVANSKTAFHLTIDWGNLIRIAVFVLLLSVAVVVLILSFPTIMKFIESKVHRPASIYLIKAEGEKPQSEKQENAGMKKAVSALVLSDEEKAELSHRIELSAERSLTPEEESLLNARVPIETGVVEKLPSQPWNLDHFKQMISEQENFYKLSLPTTYRWKLEKVFKEKYLPAQDAFKAGDLQKSRDLWVESLAFPVYGNDVRKHRGVVLTMLRPFINDTLSKIGAVNNSLAESATREKELIVSGAYQKLSEDLEKKDWAGSLAQLNQLEQMTADLDKPTASAAKVPAYPASASQVDQDIMKVLMDILNPPPTSVTNLTPLEADLRAKKEVIESLLPENIGAQKNLYEEAMSLITQEQWAPALQKLRQIRYPSELVNDATVKIRILEKMGSSDQTQNNVAAA
jgi:predicted  nucleic acid-binding Zn-ribbon protein